MVQLSFEGRKLAEEVSDSMQLIHCSGLIIIIIKVKGFPPEAVDRRLSQYQSLYRVFLLSCRVTNFSKDVSDGENYTILLAQLGADRGITRAPLQEKDLLKRAEMVRAPFFLKLFQ